MKITLTQVEPPEVTLTWECAATLQCAPSLDGPWLNVTGATSPYPTAADGPQKFFRLCLSGDCGGGGGGEFRYGTTFDPATPR